MPGLLVLVLGLLANRKAAGSVYPAEAPADEDLYRRYAEGDERAFSVLLERHGDGVMAYLVRYFGDRELARDLTQEVFLRVISSAEDFRGLCSFRTYLFRIVRHLCIDVVRSRAARPDSGAVSLDADGDDGPGLADRVAGRSPPGESRAESGELRAALEAGLARLPAEQREVFLLREVEGLSFGEIAEVLGANENTVKSRMRYALESLREALEGFGGTP